jgi:hypothetical protein
MSSPAGYVDSVVEESAVGIAGEPETVEPTTVCSPIVGSSTSVAVENVVNVYEFAVITTQTLRTDVLVMCNVVVEYAGGAVVSACAAEKLSRDRTASTHCAASAREVMQCMIQNLVSMLGMWSVCLVAWSLCA